MKIMDKVGQTVAVIAVGSFAVVGIVVFYAAVWGLGYYLKGKK
jgi:hypothetical protein